MIGQTGYDVFHKLAGELIDCFLGAAIVGATEIFWSLVYFTFFHKSGQEPLLYTGKGIGYAIVIGTFAWLIDVPLLQTYKIGIGITVAQPFVAVGSMALGAAAGIYFWHESFNTLKFIALCSGVICCTCLFLSE